MYSDRCSYSWYGVYIEIERGNSPFERFEAGILVWFCTQKREVIPSHAISLVITLILYDNQVVCTCMLSTTFHRVFKSSRVSKRRPEESVPDFASRRARSEHLPVLWYQISSWPEKALRYRSVPLRSLKSKEKVGWNLDTSTDLKYRWNRHFELLVASKVLIQLCTYMVVGHTIFFRLTILLMYGHDVGSCFRSPTTVLRVLERESVLACHFGLENGFQTSRSEECS